MKTIPHSTESEEPTTVESNGLAELHLAIVDRAKVNGVCYIKQLRHETGITQINGLAGLVGYRTIP